MSSQSRGLQGNTLGVSAYAGLCFISMGALVFEVTMLKVFSFSSWYHFGFMVISIALLGIGAAGTLRMVSPWMIGKTWLLPFFTSLFALTGFLGVWIVNQFPFDPFRLLWDLNQLSVLPIYYFSLALPFFCSGSCVALLLSEKPGSSGRIYFSDLVGAGTGAALAVFLLPALGGEKTLCFALILGAISSTIFSFFLFKDCKKLFLPSFLVLFLVVLFGSTLTITASPYKELSQVLSHPGARLLYTSWHPVSRVDVVDTPAARYAPGLSLEFRGKIPKQFGVTVDGEGLMPLTKRSTSDNLGFIDYLPHSLPYFVLEPEKVLVVNPRGGFSVMVALHHGARSVQVVETNPLLVEVVKSRFSSFTGGLYDDSRVSVCSGGVRSFLAGTDQRYDLIELPMSESSAASATGVHGLVETYLYTVEAFKEYFAHLSDRGALVVTRWLLPPPREEARLVSLAVVALEEMGVKSPGSHIAVIRSWGTMTMLVKRGELVEEDLRRIRLFCRSRGFDLVFLPGMREEEANKHNVFPEPIYHRLVTQLLDPKTRVDLINNYLFSIGPVTDDKPFFFHFFRWDKLFETYRSMGGKWQPFLEGGYLVPLILAQATIISIVLLVLPLRRKLGPVKGVAKGVVPFFVFIGSGYMLVEVVLIQKFILFLGSPVYSISTILTVMLISSGVGSLFSHKLKTTSKTISTILIVVALLIILYSQVLTPITNPLIGETLPLRIFVAALLLTPLAFLMGIPFPLTIRKIGETNPELVPWAWSSNACASVCSSVLTILLALIIGYTKVLLVAGVSYIVATTITKTFWDTPT